MLRLSQKIFLVWLAGYRPPGLPEEGGVLQEVIGPHGLWLVPVATTLGGLISGALVYGLAPETEVHGTDTVVKALHWTGGIIRARVAPVKMLASAITIGSGGSAGREGPTALIAAGFGSVYAKVLHRPERERRLKNWFADESAALASRRQTGHRELKRCVSIAVLFPLFLAFGVTSSSPDLIPPISGLSLANLQDTFEQVHNGHRHEAIDILEPRGTPVHAVVPSARAIRDNRERPFIL